VSEPSLAACWAKLDRASEHIAELKTEVVAYFESTPIRIESSSFEAETGWWIFKTDEVKRLPLRPSVIIGDILHNLRSALDHLVWQLVLFNGADPTTRNQFPIESGEQRFAKAARRMLAGVAEHHIEQIKGVQPFAQGESDEFGNARASALVLLRDLSNQDKHRLINPVMAAMGGPGAKTPLVFGGNDDAGPLGEIVFSGRIAGGEEFARVRIEPVGPKPEVSLLRTEVPAAIYLAGSEIPVLGVMPVLREVVANVLLIFDSDIQGEATAATRA
jgi:hypothetical protein